MSTPKNNKDMVKNIGEKLCHVEEQIRDIKKKITDYKQEKIFCVISIILISIVLAAGIFGAFYNCCEKKHVTRTPDSQNDCQVPGEQASLESSAQADTPNQYVDSNKADLKFKTEIGNSSINLSMKGQQNPYIRSDCFWFIIFFITTILLILLFYLIAFSSRESKLLQFITDWNEQEKEKEI